MAWKRPVFESGARIHWCLCLLCLYTGCVYGEHLSTERKGGTALGCQSNRRGEQFWYCSKQLMTIWCVAYVGQGAEEKEGKGQKKKRVWELHGLQDATGCACGYLSMVTCVDRIKKVSKLELFQLLWFLQRWIPNPLSAQMFRCNVGYL